MTPDDTAAAGLPPLPAKVYAWGFSYRKQALLRCFVGDVQVSFIAGQKTLPPGSSLLLWGSTSIPDGMMQDIKIVRLEDGFLRSVGLGADLVHPVSWVIDQQGIYYDATRPSDLENLLQNRAFPAALLERARLLRARIVAHGLSKYNVGSGGWQRPAGARVILVPGQVESDASLRFGAPGIRTNMALLQAVRQANPDAYVVYKPHPDVVAGLRASGRGEDAARRWCDEVAPAAPINAMLDAVDEVHVLTSLAGFEALLRGRKVCCYGQPFYSGWGLTTDLLAPPRRSRALSLDALVAATLILYPRYVSRVSGRFIPPEQALDELLAWRAAGGAALSWPRRLLRMGLQCWGGRR